MSDPASANESPEPRFRAAGALDRALELVRFLRRECSWDRAQTAESLIPHLLEETHEVVDAIREGDADALEGELGDLLLNLAFQVVVAEEERTMDAESVYGRLEAKMVARHPHIFGTGERRSWESLKAEEREADEGVLTGLAKGLDPLTKAHRIQERVSGVGFDWEDHRGAFAKVAEELEEVREALDAEEDDRVAEELGDLLFAVVNLTRLAGSHPTTVLARANRKFHDRFEQVEALARERGIDMSSAGLEALDALWDEVKKG
ncbi:MAG: nucleoside triphosphate pyrophosphohydrolase [Gemmatimonadota bacterium]